MGRDGHWRTFASPLFFCRRKLISRPLQSVVDPPSLAFSLALLFTLCSSDSPLLFFSHFSRLRQFLTSKEEFVSRENVHPHQPNHHIAEPMFVYLQKTTLQWSAVRVTPSGNHPRDLNFSKTAAGITKWFWVTTATSCQNLKT